jgi:hypothetical protein
MLLFIRSKTISDVLFSYFVILFELLNECYDRMSKNNL